MFSIIKQPIDKEEQKPILVTNTQEYQQAIRTIAKSKNCAERLDTTLEQEYQQFLQQICDQVHQHKTKAYQLKKLIQQQPEESQQRAELQQQQEQEKNAASKLKKQLPCYIWQAFYPNEVRKTNQPMIPTGLVFLDIDNITEQEPRQLWQNWTQDNTLIHQFGILRANISPSRCGMHIIFKADTTLDIKQNQQKLYDHLNIPQNQRDKAVHDLARLTYAVPDNYILYQQTQELCQYFNPQFAQLHTTYTGQWKGVYYTSKTTPKKPPLTIQDHHDDNQAADAPLYQGHPIQEYIQAYWQLFNEGKTPVEGQRNTLTFQIAADLRYLCGNNPETLDQAIPPYDHLPPEEKRACINSACKQPLDKMPARTRSTINKVLNNHNQKISNMIYDPKETTRTLEKINTLGITDSFASLKKNLHLQALLSIAPIIGTLATQVRLDTADGEPRHLNLMTFIVGPSGSGKGKIEELANIWLQPIREQDKINRLLDEQQRELIRAAKNQKQQPKTKKFIIRDINPDTTKAILSQMLDNAQGQHCFIFAQEADQFGASELSPKDLNVILRSAYDNSRWGTERKSPEASNHIIEKVMLNTTITGTYDAFDRFFKNAADGSAQRFAIATMPNNSFEEFTPMPPRSQKNKQNILDVAELLMQMEGTITLPKLQKKATEWIKKIFEIAQENNDEELSRLKNRVWVNAMRITTCAMLCKHAEKLIRKKQQFNPDTFQADMKKLQTPNFLQLFNQVADYLLHTQNKFLHDRILQQKQQNSVQQEKPVKKTQNEIIYEQLPETFTFQQLHQLKGGKRGASDMIINKWKEQNKITTIQRGKYKKLSF